eukprot:759307-Hanusia_phi.AAC.3
MSEEVLFLSDLGDCVWIGRREPICEKVRNEVYRLRRCSRKPCRSTFMGLGMEERPSEKQQSDWYLDFGRGVYPAYVDERVQYNHEAGSKRDILRGRWVDRKSLWLAPDESTDIEATAGSSNGQMDPSAHLLKLKLTSWKLAFQQSKSVRWVTPAYERGHLPRREVKPVIDACWANSELSCFMIKEGEKVEENNNNNNLNSSNNSSGVPTPREDPDQFQKVRWWWRDIGMGTWQAFSFEDSREIEKAWRSGNPTEVIFVLIGAPT